MYDEKGNVVDSQNLKFTWYIDNNGDIYIKYTNSGATFVLDAGASRTGFHLGAEKGNARYTFYGYMIGVGNAKGDIINFDFEEVPTGYAKKITRSAGDSLSVAGNASVSATTSSFGKASGIKKMTGAEKKLNHRR